MHIVDLDALQNQRMDIFIRGFPFLPGTVYSGFRTGVYMERKDHRALSLGIPNIRMDRPSLEMVEVQKVDEILLAEFFDLSIYTQGSLYPPLVLLFSSAIPEGFLRGQYDTPWLYISQADIKRRFILPG